MSPGGCPRAHFGIHYSSFGLFGLPLGAPLGVKHKKTLFFSRISRENASSGVPSGPWGCPWGFCWGPFALRGLPSGVFSLLVGAPVGGFFGGSFLDSLFGFPFEFPFEWGPEGPPPGGPSPRGPFGLYSCLNCPRQEPRAEGENRGGGMRAALRISHARPLRGRRIQSLRAFRQARGERVQQQFKSTE